MTFIALKHWNFVESSKSLRETIHSVHSRPKEMSGVIDISKKKQTAEMFSLRVMVDFPGMAFVGMADTTDKGGFR